MTRPRFLHPALAATLIFAAGCASPSLDPSEDAATVRSDVAARAEVVAVEDDVDAFVAAAFASPLDAEAAARLALVRAPQVRAIYEGLGIARADLVAATRARNPTLDVAALAFGPSYEFDATFVAPIFDLLTAAPRRARAEADFRGAIAAAKAEIVAAVFDARRALTNAAAAHARVENRRADVVAADDVAKLFEAILASGGAQPLEATGAAIDAAAARLALAEAETAYREAREGVNVALGLHGPDAERWTPAPPAKVSTPPTSDDVEGRAVAASFDLQRAQAALDSAAQDASLAGSRAVFGDATVGVGAIREDDGGKHAGPTVSVPLPIADGGGAANARADATVRMSEARRSALGVEIRAAARRLRDRVEAATAKAAYLRETVLPLRERFTLETLHQYNAMQTGATTVLAARRAELDAIATTIEAERAANVAALDLRELLAGVLRAERGGDAASGHGSNATIERAGGSPKGH